MAPFPSASPHILAECRDGVLWLTLNRARRKNALSTGMYAALAEQLGSASADPAVRAVVIEGQPGIFSSGNDVLDFQQNPPSADGGGPVMDFLAALVSFDKPLVAGVDGPAVGIGTTLLLHCDLVYLTPNARLRLPFVNLALVPEAGSSLLLPLLMGHVRAAELLLLGDFFDAERALALGLANAIVAPDELHAQLDRTTRRLADQPLGSLMLTKGLMRAPLRAQLETVMRAEGKLFVERLGSAETVEAFMAFFEKRQPDFRQFAAASP